MGRFTFLPVVAQGDSAAIEIRLLHPEAPGRIITRGGDIDNRLKTLLDALKMPTEQELPPGAEPTRDEVPFLCVLQDDHLVTSLTVTVERLLDSSDPTEALLLLAVHVLGRPGTTLRFAR